MSKIDLLKIKSPSQPETGPKMYLLLPFFKTSSLQFTPEQGIQPRAKCLQSNGVVFERVKMRKVRGQKRHEK
jgi:hypothetical protein